MAIGATISDSATDTTGVSALYLTLMGVTMIVAQAAIAPKTRGRASKLVHTGLAIVLLATICLWPTDSRILLVLASILLGLGVRLAMPGCNTGPTLNMDEDKQGAVAGVINANNGLAYTITSIASTHSTAGTSPHRSSSRSSSSPRSRFSPSPTRQYPLNRALRSVGTRPSPLLILHYRLPPARSLSTAHAVVTRTIDHVGAGGVHHRRGDNMNQSREWPDGEEEETRHHVEFERGGHVSHQSGIRLEREH